MTIGKKSFKTFVANRWLCDPNKIDLMQKLMLNKIQRFFNSIFFEDSFHFIGDKNELKENRLIGF